MRKVLFVFSLSCTIVSGQVPQWHWATLLDGHGEVHCLLIQPDSVDGCFVSGSFTEDLFVTGDTLVKQDGYVDGFIAHLNYAGEIVWTVHLSDPVTSMSLLAGGLLRFAVAFQDSFSVGDSSIASMSGVSILTGRIAPNGTIAELDVVHDLLDPFADGEVTAIVLAGAGDIFLAGQYGDSIRIADTTLYGWGWPNIFLTRFDPFGELIWAQRLGTAGYTQLAMDALGRLLLCAEQPGAFFAGDTLLGDGGCVLAVFDESGDLLWRYNSTGMGFSPDESPSVGSRSNGNVLFAYGAYAGPSANNITLHEFDPSGAEVWSASTTGPNGLINRPSSPFAMSGGTTLLGGLFVGPLTFGGDLVDVGANPNAFVARVDSLGDWEWVVADSGIGNVFGALAVADPSGAIYATGSFEYACTFGAFQLEPLGGQFAGFVARLGAPATMQVGSTLPPGSISIAPNPATDEIWLTVNSVAYHQFEISDDVGRTLVQGSWTGQQSLINIGSLKAGPYLLQCDGYVRRFTKL